MNILVIFLYIFLILIFLRMHLLIKKNNINFKYMFFNYSMLFVIIIVNIPAVTNKMQNLFAIEDRFSIMLMIMFIYLIYNNFIMGSHIAKQNQDIEKIVSEIAVISNKIESEKK